MVRTGLNVHPGATSHRQLRLVIEDRTSKLLVFKDSNLRIKAISKTSETSESSVASVASEASSQSVASAKSVASESSNDRDSDCHWHMMPAVLHYGGMSNSSNSNSSKSSIASKESISQRDGDKKEGNSELVHDVKLSSCSHGEMCSLK